MIYSQGFKDEVLSAFPKGHNYHEHFVTGLENGNPYIGRILEDTNPRLYGLWWDEYKPNNNL